jgi:hypothetical protein
MSTASWTRFLRRCAAQPAELEGPVGASQDPKDMCPVIPESSHWMVMTLAGSGSGDLCGGVIVSGEDLRPGLIAIR